MAGRKKHRTEIVGRLYKRTRDPIRKPKRVSPEVLSEADQILAESLQGHFISHAKPTGFCLECGKKVPPMRKVCGRCNTKRSNGGRE